MPGPLTLQAVEDAVRAWWVASRPSGPLRRGETEYRLLRSRVLARLEGH